MTVLKLYRKQMRDRRGYLLIGTGIMIGMAFLIPVSYRMMFSYLVLFEEEFGFASFVWQSWWGQAMWQFGYVFALIMGAGLKGREKAGGVMEFLLTRYVTRREVYLSKLLADITTLCLSVSVPTLVLYTLGHLSSVEFHPEYSFISAAVYLCIGITIPYGIAALFAIITGTVWKSLVAGLSWVAADIILMLLSDIPLSVTRNITHHTLFVPGTFPLISAAFILLIFAGMVCGGMLAFHRMEI